MTPAHVLPQAALVLAAVAIVLLAAAAMGKLSAGACRSRPWWPR